MSTPPTPAGTQPETPRGPGTLPARTRSASRAAASSPRQPPAPGQPAAPRDAGGRYTHADLHPEPASAAKARRVTRETLSRWSLHDLTDDAEAIASELVANAAAAAVQPDGPFPSIILAIHDRPPELSIIVWDNGPGQPAPAGNPGDDAENGRGLAIIDHLTRRRWGWWPTPVSGGKVVWATLTSSPPADAT